MLLIALPIALLPLAGPRAGGTTFDVATSMVAPHLAQATDRLADLLPADAFFVVRAESIRVVLDDLNQLMGRGADHPERWTAETLLADLDSEFAQLAQRIDLDRPAGLALRFGAGDEPIVWLALPSSDAAALSLDVRSKAQSITVLESNGYVLLSSSANADAPIGRNDVVAALAGSDLSAQIDLARVLAKFRPLVDMGLDSAEMALAEGPEEAQLAAEEYFDLTRAVLDSVQTVRVDLDSTLEHVKVSGSLTVGPDSPMAKMFAGERRNLSAGAGLLDPRSAFSFLSLSDPRGVSTKQMDWLETLGEVAPPNLRGLLQLEVESWRTMLPKTTGLNATNIDFALDGLRASSFVESTQAAALAADVQRVLASPELGQLGLLVEGPTAREVGGTQWSEYRVRMDLDSMARFFDENAVIAPEERAQAEQALAVFLGQDGLRIGVAATERFLVTRVGGDDSFARSVVARVGATPGSFDTGLLNAFGAATQVQAAWLAHLDVGQLMNQCADLAASLGQPIELPVALLGDSFPITAHAAIDGPTWRGGLEFDARDLARFVAAMDEER